MTAPVMRRAPPVPPSFRRRILIEAGPGRVTAELEDDWHRMVVTLRHDGAVVRAVEPAMKRWPWTSCPGAVARLAETFAGVALADFAGRGEKATNCTHLHDLALFAAAHAGEPGATAYDVVVTDPVDGVRKATLARDGAPVLAWSLAGAALLAPAELAGKDLGGLGEWIARLDPAAREAARILRWACILAPGRGMAMPAGMPATAFPPGNCYNFQPEIARGSQRRDQDRDLSLPGREPLADRSAAFAPGGTPAS